MGSGQERTERATSKRRGKELDKGNIAKSQDLNSALVITFSLSVLSAFAVHFFSQLQTLFFETFTRLNPREINTQDILLILLPFAKTIAHTIVPFLIILMIGTALILRMVIGKVIAKEKIKFDLNNIAPKKAMDGLKKLMNPVDVMKMVEFIKSLLKLVIVSSVGISVISNRKDELFGLLGADPGTAFAVIGSILSQMLINMCLAMLVIGIIDIKYQSFQYEKSIKMSKQEVKDEYKDMEGDPKIKAKIRSMRMKIARQRMFASIPTADVVVTNPTHYAVALKYDRLKAPAPMVVAKGVDFVAFKIREIAQSNKIPIVENRPLAQALYKLVPIDGIIPSDMFVAVAEVLAYVYNKDQK